jgi:hypothetical protein
MTGSNFFSNILVMYNLLKKIKSHHSFGHDIIENFNGHGLSLNALVENYTYNTIRIKESC